MSTNCFAAGKKANSTGVKTTYNMGKTPNVSGVKVTKAAGQSTGLSRTGDSSGAPAMGKGKK